MGCIQSNPNTSGDAATDGTDNNTKDKTGDVELNGVAAPADNSRYTDEPTTNKRATSTVSPKDIQVALSDGMVVFIFYDTNCNLNKLP